LLDALDSLGYVSKRSGRYTATAMTKKWAPVLAEGIPFAEAAAFEQWQHLEERVAGRKPPIHSYEAIEREDTWREFQAGMLALARSGVDNVVAKVKLPRTARRLLDLGGGHGLYSVEFCRRYLHLSATVFDFPQALEVTRELIAAEDMADRVSVEQGDFWTDSIGSGYDVALLFNIVHGNLPEKNTMLLQKVAGSLNPGGRVVILDQLADSNGSGPAARAIAALTGLNMYNSSGGQSYRFDEIAGWLSASGFASLRRINLLRSPGNGLVIATKTA
jgi:cyclopropane fatty-acyl-phospholipid synthase-like methyltransferase